MENTRLVTQRRCHQGSVHICQQWTMHCWESERPKPKGSAMLNLTCSGTNRVKYGAVQCPSQVGTDHSSGGSILGLACCQEVSSLVAPLDTAS